MGVTQFINPEVDKFINSKKKTEMEQKKEKEEIVPKNFDSVYSDVNVRFKASSNDHLIDLILNSLRSRLSQSEISC